MAKSVEGLVLLCLCWVTNSAFIGEPCEPDAMKLWFPLPVSRHHFIFCHQQTRMLVMERCEGERVFDWFRQQCRDLDGARTPEGPTPSQDSVRAPIINTSTTLIPQLPATNRPSLSPLLPITTPRLPDATGKTETVEERKGEATKSQRGPLDVCPGRGRESGAGMVEAMSGRIVRCNVHEPRPLLCRGSVHYGCAVLRQNQSLGFCCLLPKPQLELCAGEAVPRCPRQCPQGQECRFHRRLGFFACCPEAVSRMCPAGEPLRRPTVTGESGLVACARFRCPAGYRCHESRDRGSEGGTASFCCPSPKELCSVPQGPSVRDPGYGTCEEKALFWTFHLASLSCRQRRGCLPKLLASRNAFPDVHTCLGFCAQGLCPLGRPEVRRNGSLRNCSTSDQCSPGFRCAQPQFGRHSVCCQHRESACLGDETVQHEIKAYSNTNPEEVHFVFDRLMRDCRQKRDDEPLRPGQTEFLDLRECRAQCVIESALCPSGSELSRSARGFPIDCSHKACPGSRQICIRKTAKQAVCCQKKAEGLRPAKTTPPSPVEVCSSGGRPSTREVLAPSFQKGQNGQSPPFEGVVRRCSPYLPFACPSAHSCQRSAASRGFVCCPAVTPAKRSTPILVRYYERNACPAGLKPWLSQRGQTPLNCRPERPGDCPFTSMCQLSKVYKTFICCSSATSNNL